MTTPEYEPTAPSKGTQRNGQFVCGWLVAATLIPAIFGGVLLYFAAFRMNDAEVAYAGILTYILIFASFSLPAAIGLVIDTEDKNRLVAWFIFTLVGVALALYALHDSWSELQYYFAVLTWIVAGFVVVVVLCIRLAIIWLFMRGKNRISEISDCEFRFTLGTGIATLVVGLVLISPSQSNTPGSSWAAAVLILLSVAVPFTMLIYFTPTSLEWRKWICRSVLVLLIASFILLVVVGVTGITHMPCGVIVLTMYFLAEVYFFNKTRKRSRTS